MLNVKYVKYFAFNLVFTFEHRNETLVRLLQSPAVMLRLGYSVGEDRADICGQLRPGPLRLSSSADVAHWLCHGTPLSWHIAILTINY